MFQSKDWQTDSDYRDPVGKFTGSQDTPEEDSLETEESSSLDTDPSETGSLETEAIGDQCHWDRDPPEVVHWTETQWRQFTETETQRRRVHWIQDPSEDSLTGYRIHRRVVSLDTGTHRR